MGPPYWTEEASSRGPVTSIGAEAKEGIVGRISAGKEDERADC